MLSSPFAVDTSTLFDAPLPADVVSVEAPLFPLPFRLAPFDPPLLPYDPEPLETLPLLESVALLVDDGVIYISEVSMTVVRATYLVLLGVIELVELMKLLPAGVGITVTVLVITTVTSFSLVTATVAELCADSEPLRDVLPFVPLLPDPLPLFPTLSPDELPEPLFPLPAWLPEPLGWPAPLAADPDPDVAEPDELPPLPLDSGLLLLDPEPLDPESLDPESLAEDPDPDEEPCELPPLPLDSGLLPLDPESLDPEPLDPEPLDPELLAEDPDSDEELGEFPPLLLDSGLLLLDPKL